jgi:amino acid adenylation domain-containing protein
MTKPFEGKEQLLAALLEKEGIAVDQSSAIRPRVTASELPLSFAQERFWFLNQLEGGAHYNDHLALRLRGKLNEEALERSLNEIINRHEILRTTFVSVEGKPGQRIEAHRTISLRRFDVSDLSIEKLESEVLRQATDDLKKNFELEKSPAFRVALWCLGPDDHLFLLCINQIINDGWSLKVFTNELVTLYRSFIAGKTAELPELPIQYSDFAVWQREQLHNSELSSEMAYWKKQLSGELPVLELPSDQPRTLVKTFNGARHYISLSEGLLDSLRLLARQEQATLFMVLLAAFKTLIYRYSGQEDVAVGFPIANRDRIETEQIIGVFINPLVLRSNLSDQPTFRELLARVREMALDAYANQHLPFEKLVEALQPNRDISHPPLFQVLFDYNNVPMPQLELPDLTVSQVYLDAGTAKFDLSLELTESVNEIRGFLEYSSDLFTPAMIQRMSEHFQCLLEGIVLNPDQSVSRLPLMSAAELRTVLIDWNDTAEAPGDVLTIHGKFEAQVKQTPDRRAVICEGKSRTYEELNKDANKIAHFLLTSGIKPGSRIGICIERSPEMISCLLGVLKAGCHYVPLDPNYPKKRLEFMIEDAELSLLLTQSHLLDCLPKCNSSVFALDTGSARVESQSAENPCVAVAGDGAAYVIYTSGSTGRPKGVIGTHRGAINRFHWMWKRYSFATGEVCCQKTSLSFVDSVWEIFGPLLQGIPSVIIPDETTKDPDRFIDTLAENAVTRIVAVPTLLEMLLNRNEDLRQRLPALKYCVSSGEALSAELCRRFQNALPDTVLLNLYGSSEASADSTFYEVTPEDKLSHGAIPIGRPLNNTQVYILDRNCLPVPIGVPGELHIGGAGLASGYLNRPELTDQRFIKDPFKLDSRLYKTGDLAKYRPDGNIEYLGRTDHQVKIRGMRVEPGEIETALVLHANVSKVAVVVREQPRGNKFLVAYVVSESQSQVETELLEFLRRSLPEYMVPSFLHFLDRLPLTPSGKVDRLTLCDFKEIRSAPLRKVCGPRDKLELKLTVIWKKVLALESISVKDNFFDLGGHSLLAVRLFYEIEKALDKKLPLATLFQAPSIEKLAAIIRQKESAESESSIVPIQPNGTKPPFFCIHAAGGNVLFYRDLARRLGQDQPFYGIQARRLGGRQVAHSDVEEMAAFYIEELLVLQPNGPYYLGGSSFGGTVAFEMAQQLKARGKEVAFVALFDTNGPGYPCYLPGTTLLKSRVNDLLRRLEQQWDNMRLLRSGTRWNYLVHKAGKIRHGLWRSKRKYKDIAHTHGPLLVVKMLWDSFLGRSRRTPYASTADIPDDYRKTEGNIRTAYESYVPRFYDCHVTLFRASKQELGIIEDLNLGWDGLIADLEVYDVQGHHGSIVTEPHVQFLTPKLRRCLERAQNGTHPMTEKTPKRKSERYFAQTG